MSSSERLLKDSVIQCKLGDEGLLIHDQRVTVETQHSDTYLSCFPTPAVHKDVTSIPYADILWCEETSDNTYKITFVVQSKKSIVLQTLAAYIDDVKAQASGKNTIAHQILAKSYINTKISPSVLVITNPHGGQGKAKTIFNQQIKPILEAARVQLTVQETKYAGHAVDIAQELDVSKYDIIACVSGDGIPHEVINGFYRRDDKGLSAFSKIAVTQLPGGSGNALSLSTHGSRDAKLATFKMLKNGISKMDLMAATQLDDDGNEKTSLSFLSQCYGVIADADIGTEHLRWMGPARFDLGVAHRVLTKAKYPCELYVKYVTLTKEELLSHFDEHSKKTPQNDLTEKSLSIKGPKLSDIPPNDWIEVDKAITSNMSIFYVGKMPFIAPDVQFFPAALPNDGSMDLVITDTKSPLSSMVKNLLALDTGKHVEHDDFHHHKILSYRLTPKLPENATNYLSIDGESFPFRTFQVEVLPGILSIPLDNGKYVQTRFT